MAKKDTRKGSRRGKGKSKPVLEFDYTKKHWYVLYRATGEIKTKRKDKKGRFVIRYDRKIKGRLVIPDGKMQVKTEIWRYSPEAKRKHSKISFKYPGCKNGTFRAKPMSPEKSAEFLRRQITAMGYRVKGIKVGKDGKLEYRSISP